MKVQEHPLRDIARVLVYYSVPLIIRLLPAGKEFSLYRLMGRVYKLIARRKVKKLRDNFLEVLSFESEKQVDSEIQNYIENHFVDRLQLFSFPRLNRKNIHNYIHVDNMEMLARMLEKGRGCVIIHGHFGPAQLFIAAIALAGYPITQLGYISREGYSYIGEKVALRKRFDLEEQIPGEIFYTDQFLRPIFNKLRNNEVISNAGDGSLFVDHLGKLVSINFLGKTRPFPVGAVSMAQYNKSVLLPFFINKVPGGNYSGSFGQEIEIEPGPQGTQKAVQEFANLLAMEVRKSPGLWHFWDEFSEADHKAALN